MNARIKKGLKATGKYLLIAAAAALLSGFLFYLTKGWPIAMGLKERARQGKLVSVEVTRQGETATLTEEEDLLLASGTAEILTVFLPGSPSEEKPETEYTFTFSDGTQTRVGATEAAVFRDGKAYSPAGDKQCGALFLKMTEGLFFLDRAIAGQ